MSGMTTFSNEKPNAFLNQALSLCSQLLADILIDIDTLGDFTPETEAFLTRQLQNVTSNIGKFVEVTSLVAKYLSGSRRQDVSEIRTSHVSLLSIMNAVSRAQKNSDLVALEDLIKHDLKDNLTQWKIAFIPQTQKHLST
ncbi:MAG TPA: hypothetical protein VNJ01_12965 [Bacteriovoracaceae bacterium]|nr:hypothetical protein [Bacteriovoracaceae bacterium]